VIEFNESWAILTSLQKKLKEGVTDITLALCMKLPKILTLMRYQIYLSQYFNPRR